MRAESIFALLSSLSIDCFLVTHQKMHAQGVILYTTMRVVIIILLSFKQVQSYTVAANVFKDDPLLIQLSQLTDGLLYMSEADYPLEPVSFSTPLTNKQLIKFAEPQSPTGTRVERQDFTEFLGHHTSEKEDEMLY